MGELYTADYIIFALSIVASFGIGVYYACRKDKNKSTEDYLVASRKMNVIPVAISLLVSILSAIALLGNSSEVYYFGPELMFQMVAFAIGVLATSVTFVPLFHGLKLTSIHEYLFLRYKSRGMVYFGCFLQNLTFCLVNGMAMYAAAMVTDSMAGMSVQLGMLVIGIVATIYTTVGGYQAVVWCDVFQAAIILIGVIVIDVLGIIEVGGIKETFRIYHDQGRSSVNFSLSLYERNTFWGFSFGLTISIFTLYGIIQTVAQRYMSLSTLTEAKCTVYYTIVQNVVIVSLTGFSGVVAFAYYTKQGCDPLAGKKIFDPNQILPYFIKDVLDYPGVGGIFVACIFCATLANLSSTLNSISAMIWDDVLRPKLESRDLSDLKKSLITKVIALCGGIISTCCAFLVAEIGGTLVEITFIIVSASLAPVCIIIVLGAISPKSSWKTAIGGALMGTSIILWMSAGHTLARLPEQMKPVVSTNCTYGSETSNNSMIWTNHIDYSGHHNSTEGMIGHTHDMWHSTTEGLVGDTQDNNDDVMGLYKVSFVWYFPVGFILGISAGILLTFIPVLANKDQINSDLFFPFVAHILRKRGYFSLQSKDPGLYMKVEDVKEMQEFHRKDNEIINTDIASA